MKPTILVIDEDGNTFYASADAELDEGVRPVTDADLAPRSNAGWRAIVISDFKSGIIDEDTALAIWEFVGDGLDFAEELRT